MDNQSKPPMLNVATAIRAAFTCCNTTSEEHNTHIRDNVDTNVDKNTKEVQKEFQNHCQQCQKIYLR